MGKAEHTHLLGPEAGQAKKPGHYSQRLFASPIQIHKLIVEVTSYSSIQIQWHV